MHVIQVSNEKFPSPQAREACAMSGVGCAWYEPRENYVMMRGISLGASINKCIVVSDLV